MTWRSKGPATSPSWPLDWERYAAVDSVDTRAIRVEKFSQCKCGRDYLEDDYNDVISVEKYSFTKLTKPSL